MCNSIMHYNVKNRWCPEIKAKPGLYCKDGRIGRGEKALPEDWLMINRAHCKGSTQKGCQHKDSNRQCGAWQKRGECQKNPWYMLENCAKSCKCNWSNSFRRRRKNQSNIHITSHLKRFVFCIVIYDNIKVVQINKLNILSSFWDPFTWLTTIVSHHWIL